MSSPRTLIINKLSNQTNNDNLDSTGVDQADGKKKQKGKDGDYGKEKGGKGIKKGRMGKILVWNKGNSSFMTKKPDLETLIEKHKPLLLGVLEANMGEHCHGPSLMIDGYRLERDNLAAVGGKTRAAVYIHEGLSYRRRMDLEVVASPMVWLEINPDSKESWLAFVGYREFRSLVDKDKAKSLTMAQQLLRLESWRVKWTEAEKEHKPLFLLGDWNVDVTPWTSPKPTLTAYQASNTSLLTLLREMASENGVELIHTPPTRKQGKDIPTIIDLCMTNRPNQIQNVSLLPSSSDHLVLCVEKVNKPKLRIPGPRKIRSFKHYSKQGMIDLLNIPMIDSLIGSTDTNLVANVLINHITEAINVIAPIKVIQPRVFYAPYLSDRTKMEMTKRDQLKSVANNSGEEADIIAFKKLKNLTLKHQRMDKVAWAKELIGPTNNDGKKIWNTVQKITKSKKSHEISKMIINGSVIEDKGQIAEGLNAFFVSKVKKLIEEMPSQRSNLLEELKKEVPVDVPLMELKELTMSQLDILVKRVKSTPAAGIDGISGRIFLDIFDHIKKPLLHLINLSLWSGIYPEVLKLTKIIPVLKDGKDPLVLSSYRPVCNLSVVGKILERSIMNQIQSHITLYGLFNKDQHGGRSNHSTTTCLGEILDDSRTALEGKQLVALVAVDLSAAYDLCDHSILWEKCRLLNLCSGTLRFLRSFLQNRSNLTEIEGIKSSVLATGKQGVVQGGPSSGLLFNIYINSMPAQVNNRTVAIEPSQSTCKQYVDDGTIIVRGKSISQLRRNIISDFRAVQDYLIEHRMVINASKTQLMLLLPHKEKEQFQIELDGNTIKSQKSIKILGLTLSDDLKFDEYIWKGKSSLIKRIKYRTSMVRTLKSYLPPRLIYQIGNSVINSTIQYGAALWGATSNCNIQKVQSAQIRAGRLLTGNWRRGEIGLHRQQLLHSMKWPNVKQLIASATLNMVKSATSGDSSVGTNSLFRVTKPDIKLRKRGLRVDHKGPSTRTLLNFSANASFMFNNLPPHLKEQDLTTRQFKRKLKIHIMDTFLLTQH